MGNCLEGLYSNPFILLNCREGSDVLLFFDIQITSIDIKSMLFTPTRTLIKG